MSLGKAKDAEIWDYERKQAQARDDVKPCSACVNLGYECPGCFTRNKRLEAKAEFERGPSLPHDPPEDPVVSAVTKEIKESYGYGHDDGYRTATHDIADWLRKKGQHSPDIRQLANEIAAGTWRKK